MQYAATIRYVINREKESCEKKSFNPLVDKGEVKKGCQMKIATAHGCRPATDPRVMPL